MVDPETVWRWLRKIDRRVGALREIQAEGRERFLEAAVADWEVMKAETLRGAGG